MKKSTNANHITNYISINVNNIELKTSNNKYKVGLISFI